MLTTYEFLWVDDLDFTLLLLHNNVNIQPMYNNRKNLKEAVFINRVRSCVIHATTTKTKIEIE